MIRATLAVLSFVLLQSPAHAADGIVTVPSTQSTKASLDKLESIAAERGLKIFARIDHAANARSIGEELRPTELLILGNPKGGTVLMQCAQQAGIDLPMRVLAWEDATGQVWLGYRDPAKLDHAYSGPACGVALSRVNAMFGELLKEAAQK
jgi:uncharacterized protein (DUF302 family)